MKEINKDRDLYLGVYWCSSTFDSLECYRFGFNGKEMDNEWNGNVGAMYDYGFRIYDPRLGRFLSVDPLFRGYPWYTPYQFAGNKPIWKIDLDGLEEADADNIITETKVIISVEDHKTIETTIVTKSFGPNHPNYLEGRNTTTAITITRKEIVTTTEVVVINFESRSTKIGNPFASPKDLSEYRKSVDDQIERINKKILPDDEVQVTGYTADTWGPDIPNSQEAIDETNANLNEERKRGEKGSDAVTEKGDGSSNALGKERAKVVANKITKARNVSVVGNTNPSENNERKVTITITRKIPL